MLRLVSNTFATKFAAACLNLFVVVLLSRQLGAAGKGEASIILTNLSLFILFAGIAGGSAYAYLAPSHNMWSLIKYAYSWALLLGLLFFILYEYISDAGYAYAVTILAIIGSFTSVNLNILLGRNRIKTYNQLLLLQSLLLATSLSVTWLFVAVPSISDYLAALYISGVSVFLLSFGLVLKNNVSFRQLASVKMSQVLQLGLHNQGAHIFYLIAIRLSYYLLLGYAGESTVGIFSNALAIAEGLWLISNSFATVQYAQVINNGAQAAKNITLLYIRWSSLLLVGAIFVLICIPENFYLFLFGEEFAGIKYCILLLSPGIVIYNLALLTGHYFSGTGKFKINTLANFLGLCISAFSLLFLLPRFGLTHACIFNTISYLSIAVVLLFFFYRENKFTWKEIIFSGGDIKKIAAFFKKQHA